MTSPRKRIAIVGQGVIGLTCASRLLERGYSPEVYSREALAATTSMSAGAYWWPHKAYPEERVSKWSKESYDKYLQLRTDPESGVHFEKHYRFCIDLDESAYARHLLDEWEEIDGSDHGVPCAEAYLATVPVIDVPVFLSYLRDTLQAAGVRFHVQELRSPAELFPDYDMVLNCTGVWARHFVGDDEVFPIRGQAVRITLPEGLRESTRVFEKSDRFTLVLPRSTDVILGGTAQEGGWSRRPREEDTAAIFRRCRELVPRIGDSRILDVTVGLRPGRKEARLELELSAPGRPVIHNYGHGGGGFTVAWGCANEVALLADQYFLG